MFCPECGKENGKGAKFCEFCGSKMAETAKPEKRVLKPETKKQMSKKNKIVITLVAIVLVVLITGYFVLAGKYSAKSVAEGYFIATMNKDVDSLYKYFDVSNKDFTSKEVFKKVYDGSDSKLVNYSVLNENKSVDGLSSSVTINYTLEGKSKADTETISLVKDKKNKILVFPNWKIANSTSMIVKENKFIVPKDADLKIAGIEVNKKYKKDDGQYDAYIIPEMFKGTYDAIVTLKNGIKLSGKVKVSGGTNYLTRLELTDAKEVEKDIPETLNKIYKSAIDGKKFDEIKSVYEYKGANLEDLKEAYETLEEAVSSNGLKEFKVTKSKVKSTTITDDGYLNLAVEVDYEYTINYSFLGEEKTKTDDSSRTTYLTFDYADGKYKLIDMSYMITYFSRY